MAVQVTPDEVFEFMGSPTDIRNNNTTMIESLIENVVKEIELILGRKIEKETFTNVLFEHGLNCEIYEDKLYLKGKYRDVKTITAISEDNSSLTVVSDSDDGNDYYYNEDLGMLKRVNRWWSRLPSAVKISGTLGLVDAAGNTVEDIRQLVIEMTAVKSALWKSYYNSEEFTVTELPAPTKRLLNKYKLRDF